MGGDSDTRTTPSARTAGPSRLRRARRIVLGGLASLAIVLGLAGAVAVFALAHLEHPWVKPTVVSTLREALALDVDFRTLSFSLRSGVLHGTGITVAQPPRFASRAPPFVTLREGDVVVDVRSLFAETIRIRSATFRGLSATYVVDETTDSLALLFPTDPSEPIVPLSRSLDSLRGLGIDVARFEITDGSLAYVELEAGRAIRRARLDALGARGHYHDRGGRLDVAFVLAPAAERRGAVLRVTQTGRAASADATVPARASIDAHARVALRVAASVRDAVSLSMSARVLESQGRPSPSNAPLDGSLDLAVRFDERTGRTWLDLRRLALFGEVVRASLRADVDDAHPDTLRDATGRVDIVFDEPPILPEGLDARGVEAHLVLDHATLSPAGVEGRVDLRASAASASAAMDGRHVGAERLSLSLATEADVPLAARASTTTSADPSVTALAVALSLGEIVADDASTDAHLTGRDFTATFRGPGLVLAEAGIGGLRGATAPDVVDASLVDLELTQSTTASAHLEAPRLHAEGVGLAAALASDAAANGRVTLDADRLEGRSGADRVDVAPLAIAIDLEAFLASATGLFGLGGRAEIHVTTRGSARSGSQSTRFAGLSPVIRADFDRRSLEGTLPVASLEVREAGESPLAMRDADLRFVAVDPLALAPPSARGRLTVEGRIGHVDTGENAMSLPSLELVVNGEGGVYALAGRAAVSGLETSRGRFEGTHRLELDGRADLRSHVADLEAHLRPREGTENAPSLDATLHVAIDPATSALDHRLSVETARLSPEIARFLPEGTHAGFTELSIESRGRWADLFARRPVRGSVPELAPDFVASMQGEEHVELVVRGLDASRGTERVESPRMALSLRLAQRDGAASATLEGNADAMSVHDGADVLVVHDLRPRIDVRFPNAAQRDLASVEARVTAARIDQDLLEGYPVSSVELRAAIDAAPGEIRMRDLVLSNAGGHSTLRMTGAYESDVDAVRASEDSESSIDGREAMWVTGELAQEVGPLAGTSFARAASGRLRVGFEVQSGDLRSYRGIARLVADGVDFTSADGTLVVERLNGEIPIEETVTLLETGPVLDPGAGVNALSRARFPDVQPFLDTDAFVTSDRIEWLGHSLGPMAGNVRVAGTTVTIDRLQMGYRGGTLSGQLEADLMPGASHVSFRGSATGIHTARGGHEVLDANVAFRFVPESLALDGSMHLVRVSRTHLLELLDALDPYHEDSDMNTVRSLMRLGYPRFVRLRATEGLMDFEVSLGGLASAVRIDPIRAIPIAPLLEEYAAPIVETFFPRAREHVVSSGPREPTPIPAEDDHD